MGRDEPAIQYLFKPRSVAVIGSSQDTGKIGHKILDNIATGRVRSEGMKSRMRIRS
jgi:acyl-CoA synthetase (NDP forming)